MSFIGSPMFLYLAECEGHDNLVSTRTAKINAVIKDLRNYRLRGYNPNNYIDTVLARHGLAEDMLSDVECERINNEVIY